MEFILASSSPRRVELLKQIGLKFKIIPPELDESINQDSDPKEIVMELSKRKAMNVARRVTGESIIISADTIVVKDSVMGKPANEQEAFSMLKALQNSWHDVITGITLIDTRNFNSITSYEITRVKMKPLSDDTIMSYIRTGEPFDKAGGYGIQSLGALLVEKIDGCYFNVVGLPLAKLNTMLGNMGIRVL
ncbi:MAG TPA: septum formation inhibitor Maf [Clostridiaceae bacterium]|nr:septum formation inhibitor Maf [Clostridiaceae bacterium]